MDKKQIFLWDFVVKEKPLRSETIPRKFLDIHNLNFMRYVLGLDTPTKDYFHDVYCAVIRAIYEEIAPFPKRPTKIVRKSVISAAYDLQLAGQKPFACSRTDAGVEVLFVNTENPCFQVDHIPYCRCICGFTGRPGIQCSRWGSFCQIELGNILPIWNENDHCSEESALKCPIFNSQSMSFNKRAFYRWLKKRVGYDPKHRLGAHLAFH